MAERITPPRQLLADLDQTATMVEASAGLNADQLAKYTELVPAMLTADAYTDPVEFAYKISVARELAVWMTSDEFYRLKAAHARTA